MKSVAWRHKIQTACEDAGTYRPYFDAVIATLADTLAQRDEAMAMYEKSGGKPIVAYTNKSGATNPTPNPMLTLANKLNDTALSYWRDLGLTPAGLKKIDEAAMKPKKMNTLEKVLRDLA